MLSRLDLGVDGPESEGSEVSGVKSVLEVKENEDDRRK